MRFIFLFTTLFISLQSFGQTSTLRIEFNFSPDYQYLFAGYDNHIKIVPAKNDTNTYVVTSPGNDLKKIDQFDKVLPINEYSLYPRQNRRIKLIVQNVNDRTDQKVFHFNVVVSGDPKVYLDKAVDEELCSRKSRKVSVHLPPDNPMKSKFIVVSFQLFVPGSREMKTTGSKLTRQMRRTLKNMKPGQISLIVQCKDPGGIVRNIGAVFQVE